jgi:hypothetical protein
MGGVRFRKRGRGCIHEYDASKTRVSNLEWKEEIGERCLSCLVLGRFELSTAPPIITLCAVRAGGGTANNNCLFRVVVRYAPEHPKPGLFCSLDWCTLVFQANKRHRCGLRRSMGLDMQGSG